MEEKMFRKWLMENSTDDAKKTLDAIIGFMEKQDSLDTDGKEILKTGKGINDSFKENKVFTDKQAHWIYKTSVALFK